MTWFRTDDDLPEHVKADALEAATGDPGTLAAAWMTWLHMGCDCARRRTDGVFSLARAHRAVRLPPALVTTALGALVTVGLLDVHPDGYCFHDWSDYQPTKEELDADRRANADRQKAWRVRQREMREAKARNAVTNAVTDSVTNGVRNERLSRETTTAPVYEDTPAPVTAPRPVPSRPVPEIQKSEPVAFAQGAPATLAVEASKDSGPDPRDLELEALRAKAAKDDARRARNREKAKAREENPPPFSIGQAFEAVASKAGARFSPGVERDWTQGIRISVAKLIRTYPTLSEWECLGSWLTAGGEAFRGNLGPSWAASSACSDAMARARDWQARGGGPVDPKASPMVSGIFELRRPTGRDGRPEPSAVPPPLVRPGMLAVEQPALSPDEVKAQLARLRAASGTEAGRG